MAERLLAVGLRRAFGTGDACAGVPAPGVHGIDLTVVAGEIHALVGLNGAGKTTLLRLLLGMVQPDAGEVRIDGVLLPAMSASGWARVGHLLERPFGWPELDVTTNLALAARLHGCAPTKIPHRVSAIVAELDLGRYARVRTRVLSAGNWQRLGLAAALLHDPTLIVLDEPTNALDPAGVRLLREVLLRRAAAGVAVLVSSHHLDEVARIADRITVVNRGEMVCSLDPHGVDLERTFFERVLAHDQGHTV